MPSDDRDVELSTSEAPLEGDGGEAGEREAKRQTDLGRALLSTRLEDVKPCQAVTLPVDAPVSKAIEVMRKKGLGAVLVVERKRPRKLAGILTERDLLQRVLAKRNYARLPLEKVMTKAPETLRREHSLAYALNKMSVGRFRHVPIVDERGVPVGMLSGRDVVDFIAEVIPEAVLNLPPQPELEVHRTVDGD